MVTPQREIVSYRIGQSSATSSSLVEIEILITTSPTTGSIPAYRPFCVVSIGTDKKDLLPITTESLKCNISIAVFYPLKYINN